MSFSTLFRPCPCCNGSGVISNYDEPIPSAPARPTDPDTSHAAADRHYVADIRRFSARSRQAQLLAAVAARPMTAQEAAIKVLGLHGSISRLEGCRRRMSDLVAAGMIVDSTYRRPNIGSPDPAIVWEITDYGRRVLQHLDVDGWSIP
jgi:hypothetical protein